MKSKNSIVAFVHVEKAAGTTFIHILRHNFFLAYIDVRPFFGDSKGVFRSNDLMVARRLLPGLRCIAGHSVVPLSGLFDGGADARLITIMRDPVKRYLSQYQHWVEKKNLSISFEEFLEVEELWNFQTRKYAGRVSLEDAKRVLREKFFLVGYVEAFDEFLILLQKKFEDTKFDASYRRHNLAHNEVAVNDIAESHREQILERNQVDIELYNYVRDELYPQYIAQYGPSFNKDLEEFKARNLSFEPPMLKRYMDYVFRKIYIEPVSGIVRLLNGKPYKGSY